MTARTRPYKEVAIGGTFDVLHRGHKILLRTAFRAGDRVLIGLSRNGFVKRLVKNHRVDPYPKRKRELVSFLKRERLLDRAKIIPLDDPYGPIINDSTVSAVVVEPDDEEDGRQDQQDKEKAWAQAATHSIHRNGRCRRLRTDLIHTHKGRGDRPRRLLGLDSPI